ncbi:MAG: N-acetyltransferase [Rhodospirillales bacterium]|nr:N-acetyltransferase [Rhodospirillales bacterium]
MFTIIPQQPEHTALIETLLDKAFGENRLAKTSYSFRDGVEDIPGLRFVALQGGRLIGTIRFWPVTISGDPSTGALLLGPLGVAPDHQGQGIGAALIQHGLEMAREQGHRIVLLVGGLTYYGRFGFGPANARDIFMPSEQPHRLLVRELANDALMGIQGDIVPATK